MIFHLFEYKLKKERKKNWIETDCFREQRTSVHIYLYFILNYNIPFIQIFDPISGFQFLFLFYFFLKLLCTIQQRTESLQHHKRTWEILFSFSLPVSRWASLFPFFCFSCLFFNLLLLFFLEKWEESKQYPFWVFLLFILQLEKNEEKID